MLMESYKDKLKNLPENSIKVDVRFPSIFSPPEDLLFDFNEIRWKLMKKGKR